MGNVSGLKLTLTALEAARAANVSIPTMYAWLHKTNFPALRVGRKWLIPVDAFRRWLETQAGE
jgi:excisionase family DNA binding protein